MTAAALIPAIAIGPDIWFPHTVSKLGLLDWDCIYQGSLEAKQSMSSSQQSSVLPYVALEMVAMAAVQSAGYRSLSGLHSLYGHCLECSAIPSSQQSISLAKGPHGEINCRMPPPAPPMARSHLSLWGSV